MQPARAVIGVVLLALAACGEGVTLETAWCDEMLESEMMARALRGETIGEAVDQAKQHCVLIPAGTPFSTVAEETNDFGQAYIQADVTRPDTGQTATLWVRKAAAGIE